MPWNQWNAPANYIRPRMMNHDDYQTMAKLMHILLRWNDQLQISRVVVNC